MNSGWPRWLDFLQPKVQEFPDTFMASRSQLNQQMIHWLPDPERVPLTLLLVHYPPTFEQLQTVLEQANVPYQIHVGPLSPPIVNQMHERQWRFRQTSATSSNQRHPTAGVCLALTGQLSLPTPADSRSLPRHSVKSDSRLAKNPVDPSTKIGVLVAERHQFRAQDDRVREFCRSLASRCLLGYFIALDDPLMAGKIDLALQQLLEHYGMKPDEPLQSALLERLLRRTQRNALLSRPDGT